MFYYVRFKVLPKTSSEEYIQFANKKLNYLRLEMYEVSFTTETYTTEPG